MVINPQAFFKIMQHETSWRVDKGIPSTAKLRGFLVDPSTQNLVMFIEDSSFPEIDVTSQVSPLLETAFSKIERAKR